MEPAPRPGPAPLRRMAQALWAWKDRRPLLSLLALAVAVRLLMLLAAFLGGRHIPPWAEAPWDRGDEPWRYLARWDAGFYMDIAEHGRDIKWPAWAFEPGYPIAIRATMAVLPMLDVVEAGVLVSTAGLFACVPLLYHLTASWFDRDLAWRATAIFLLLPGSFYLGVVYSEGMFMAVVVGFFVALRHRWWLLAGVLASVAAVTRPQGLLVPLALGVAVLLERPRAGRIPLLAWLSLPLAAILPALNVWSAMVATGDPLASMHAREALWPHVHLRTPVIFFLGWMTPVQKAATLLGALLLFTGLAWAWLDAVRRGWRAPLEAYAFSLMIAFVTLCYSEAVPALRYVMPMLCIPWALGALVWEPRKLAWLGGASLVLALAVGALYAGWYPLY